MSAISIAVAAAGGPVAAAKVCGVSRQAVDKWLDKGSLPRTDYTGETDYAGKLAIAATERGSPFDPRALLDRTLAQPESSNAA